jgi:predicted dehydrogenase
MKPVKIGVIGCGAISGAYFSQCPKFEMLEVAACADLLPERAQAKAAEFNVPKACTVDELLADKEIEIVVNLTIPKAHHSLAMAAVQAGKSVWNEKPLTITRDEGRELLAAAKANGVIVGCAPDTFLGGGHQTCRKLIDDGWIGQPIAATAFMLCHGHESWHPDPEFYYKAGGGPMFDMGPYYLTALVNMLGPVKSIAGSTRVTFPERTITSQPKHGTQITVDVPTHVVGVLNFQSGAIGTIVTSFDVWRGEHPPIEIYGTHGTLSVPDPNGPGGKPRIFRPGMEGWQEIPHTHVYGSTSRSTGVADMAYAIRTGRPHRASGELAFHVLDIMHGVHDASDAGKTVTMESTVERPAMLPMGLREGQLDAGEAVKA